jgi:hypothetical protein
MNPEEWEKRKREAEDFIRERKEVGIIDRDIVLEHAPISHFVDKLSIVGNSCNCTAQALRQGIPCEICKLIQRTDQFMTNLFKDKSEGRTSFGVA